MRALLGFKDGPCLVRVESEEIILGLVVDRPDPEPQPQRESGVQPR